MPGLDIVGLGLSTLDVLMRLGEMPTWENTGRVSSFGLDGGGPVGTACVAASRLGASVGYIGTAGTDDVAAMKLKSFTEAGVDLTRLVRRDGAESQVIFVYVEADTGERHFSGIEGFGAEPLQPGELDRDYITSAKILHLDGTHREAGLQAAMWMHEAGRKVAIDCGTTTATEVGEATRETVRHVDYLICGHGFGRALTGHDDVRDAGRAALDMGPSIFVETRGEEGSYTVTRDARFYTPAFPVDVVDTTGAGDVYHGAYLVGLLKGWELEFIAQFATAVSALKCMSLGGRRGIPSYAATVDFLADRDIEPS